MEDTQQQLTHVISPASKKVPSVDGICSDVEELEQQTKRLSLPGTGTLTQNTSLYPFIKSTPVVLLRTTKKRQHQDESEQANLQPAKRPSKQVRRQTLSRTETLRPESTMRQTARSSRQVLDNLVTLAASALPSEFLQVSESSEDVNEDEDEDKGDEEEDESVLGHPAMRRQEQRRFFLESVELPQSALTTPESCYEGFRPPVPRGSERIVLQEFLDQELKSSDTLKLETDEFVSYILEDFTIYHAKDRVRAGNEMAMLSDLAVHDSLLFDGVLTNGKTRHFLQGITFNKLSIGQYLVPEKHHVKGAIWIQSFAGKAKSDTWYELGHPSKAYARFFYPFFWLANFTKYFIDFLHAHGNATLLDFKSKFFNEINNLHESSNSFKKWHQYYNNNKDFRSIVSTQISFLYMQTYSVTPELCDAEIWHECLLHDLTAIKPRNEPIMETVVTPYVYTCFKDMFGPYMLVEGDLYNSSELKKKLVPVVYMSQSTIVTTTTTTITPMSVVITTDTKTETLTSPPKPALLSSPVIPEIDACRQRRSSKLDINVGDVIAIERDAVTSWQGTKTLWYCYVQNIENTKSKGEVYDVVWLYSPEDTPCANMVYPYPDELFFSDHCSHGEITHGEIVCKASVSFMVQGSHQKGPAEFFIRNKYCTEESEFVTLKETDLLICGCTSVYLSEYDEITSKYKIGDAILVESVRDGLDVLEPAVIISFDKEQAQVQIRELARYEHDVQGSRSAEPNELVWTENLFNIDMKFISRKCHVIFTELDASQIPKLYAQGGALDMFYITSYITSDSDIPKAFASNEYPTGMTIGIDTAQIERPLRGLDLFCGGGSLGRGLEELGAIKNVCAVDLFSAALHTYRANLSEPKDVNLYLGSVNNVLHDAINRHRKAPAANVPLPGEIDFISAGSPCQGFSVANNNKDSDGSLRNCSLVASVAAFIDVYRPKYAILENVPDLAVNRKKADGSRYNVLSQLLCSLVGMGYQVQKFLVDSWSHGSCQSRTRLFVCITAPGLPLLPRPSRSHGYSSSSSTNNSSTRTRSIMTAPNGVRIGHRQSGPCPFPIRTVHDMMDDLPRLGDGHVGMCIPYPDHHQSRFNNIDQRQIMAHIPRYSHNNNDMQVLGYWQAVKSGYIPSSLQNLYPQNKPRSKPRCKSWSRIPANGLCRTITTCLVPQCAFTGQWVHYQEPRLLTVMEARRAQGIPDDEVIIGRATEAFKIVGNGVDRYSARALGMSLRNAVDEWRRTGGGPEENERKGERRE